MTILSARGVVTPAGVLDDGWVATSGGRISAVGTGPAPQQPEVRATWLLPGYIDIHVHGGGGHDATASPQDMAAAVSFHCSHGTTRTLVSLVTAPVDSLLIQLGWVADLAGGRSGTWGQVVGAHLEGPFLSRLRCGAQNPKHLRPPDREALAGMVAAARGTLRSITIAPELPGALELIGDAVAAGVVVAIGHTDAGYSEAKAAIEAGASLATHLFNGMRPLDHRQPGVVGALLTSELACELINDGVHLHPAILELVARLPLRPVLITDAIQAAGGADGEYLLGGQQIRVVGGQARLVGADTLAGSTLTMDDAVRRAVGECGWSIEAASAAASGNPARVLGIESECGAIAEGLAADLVLLDQELRVEHVMVGGRWAAPTGRTAAGS